MLDPVAQLGGDLVGDVDRVLSDEVDADAFGADQPDDLLDLLEECVGGVLEQQVGFVEEEAQLRLVRVANLGERLEQLGQEPQEERGVEPGGRHQLVGGQNIDDSAALVVDADEVGEVERRLTEEMVATLAAQLKQRALDGADRLLRNIAILEGQLVRSFANMDQHRLKVVEVEDQQAFLVGHVESDRQHAFLDIVEVEHPREKERPHLGDRRANGMTLLAVKIPELHRIIAIAPVGHADLGGAGSEQFVILEGR